MSFIVKNMTNQFWDAKEIQKIFDEEITEAIVTATEVEKIGDRLQSKGYRLIKMRDLIQSARLAPDSSQPRASFVLGMGEKLHPLLEIAIAILRESLERDKSDERKVQIALEVLGIAFTSGMIDL